MRKLLFLLLLLIGKQLSFAQFKKDTTNIKKLGAVGDGVVLNTTIINKAIVSQNKKGGGVVLIPAGIWLTGPIDLLSNVNLHLAKGAIVVFSSDFSLYPLVVSSFEGVNAARCKSPITAEKATNIGITGEGIMDGNGYYWRPVKKEKLSDGEWKKHLKQYGGVVSDDKKTWYPSAAAAQAALTKDIGKLINGKTLKDFEGIKDFLRPNMIRINECDKVFIEDVTFQNSPAWTTHLLLSKNITVKKLKVFNPWYGTNTDAIDLESCKDVVLEDCVFDTGDDGITIKSGRDEDGRKRGVPTENVFIKNCTVYKAHGGFVVGSEMSGGVRNIVVTDCNFIGSDIGLRFKTVRGRGGVVENIVVKNIRMKDIPGEAILFDMYYAATDPAVVNADKKTPPVVQFQPVTEATPVFRNVSFDQISCSGAAKAVFVRGIPEMPVQQIKFSNLNITSEAGIEIQEAMGLTFDNIQLVTKKTDPLIYVVNATQCSFTNISFGKQAKQLFLLQGDRTSAITLAKTNTTAVEKLVVGEFGVPETVVAALEKNNK